MQTIAQHKQLVQLCLQIAAEKYGELPHIDIRYDLKSRRAAGQAGYKVDRRSGARQYFLRFNPCAFSVDWDHMTRETIPHEIAHIIAYVKPELGASGHNHQWRRIAQSLGCTGNRCHNMDLSTAPGVRKANRFVYTLPSGITLELGPKHHKQVQMYGERAGIRVRATRELIDRSHFVKKAA